MFREVVDKAIDRRNDHIKSSAGKSASPEMMKLLAEASKRFTAEGHGDVLSPNSYTKTPVKSPPYSPSHSASERSRSSTTCRPLDNFIRAPVPFSTSPGYDEGMEASDFVFDSMETPVPSPATQLPPVSVPPSRRSAVIEIDGESPAASEIDVVNISKPSTSTAIAALLDRSSQVVEFKPSTIANF